MEIQTLYSNELKRLLDYMSTNLVDDNPTLSIGIEYFLLSVLENTDCLAYKILNNYLSSIILDTIHDSYYELIHNNSLTIIKPNREIKYSPELTKFLLYANYEKEKIGDKHITSEHVILALLNEKNEENKIQKFFLTTSLTYDIFFKKIMEDRMENEGDCDIKKENDDSSIKKEKIHKLSDATNFLSKNKKVKTNNINTFCVNLNELAEKGKIDKLVGREKEIEQIIKILGRRKKNNSILVGESGAGKCLAKGTKILMYDGTYKKVENIKIGDELMGCDSKPRNVLSLGYGIDDMYEIHQKNGITYTVNAEHILSLKGLKYHNKIIQNKIYDIPLKEYQLFSKTEKSHLLGYKAGLIKFQTQEIKLDPYFLGLWLGDGKKTSPLITNIDEEIINYLYDFANLNGLSINKNKINYYITSKNKKRIKFTNVKNGEIEIFDSIKQAMKEKNICYGLINDVINGKQKQTHGYYIECVNKTKNKILDYLKFYNLINNKHIPHVYKINDINTRLQVLAGIIDSDGTISSNGYEIIQKNEILFNDIVFLCRSLGLNTKIGKPKIINGTKYNRLRIYGKILLDLPIKIKHKKIININSNKDSLKTKIDYINHIGKGEYFGFVIDGDKRFILEDFTVTHNTAICEGLAYLIQEGNVPQSLSKKKIVSLDITSMLAGTQFRGMFEERMKGLLDELKSSKDYILFIDDIHTVLSDKPKSDIDIAAMLNNSLNEGDIQIIGTTSFKEYRNTFDNNLNLARKFQKVIINPSSINESINILTNIKEYYEKFHGVKYTDGALKACVELADKYISERNLPDSAIDILDESGSAASISINEPDEIKDIRKKLISLKRDKNIALKNDDYEKVDNITHNENAIKIELSNLEYKIKREYGENGVVIDVENIYNIVSEKTGIPITKLTNDEKKKLLDIDNILKKSIIGQDEAIERICKVIKRNRVGLSLHSKTMANIFALGGSGCGKTLLAKKLAKEVFGSEKYLVRFDMSEFSDKTSINKLIGSNPGYVGYDNGGQLTEIIKNKKHCVLLLDEIEKADKEVYNIFLQLFDEGCLTDNTGQKVDFKNVIVILTSNVGAKEVNERGKGIGLLNDDNLNKKDIIQKELKRKFPPEFINRLDDIIYFNTLTDDNLKDIIKLELNNLSQRIKTINYLFEWNELTIEYIFSIISKEKEYGARPIIRAIQDEIENKITDLLLDNEYTEGHIFKVFIENKELIVI